MHRAGYLTSGVLLLTGSCLLFLVSLTSSHASNEHVIQRANHRARLKHERVSEALGSQGSAEESAASVSSAEEEAASLSITSRDDVITPQGAQWSELQTLSSPAMSARDKVQRYINSSKQNSCSSESESRRRDKDEKSSSSSFPVRDVYECTAVERGAAVYEGIGYSLPCVEVHSYKEQDSAEPDDCQTASVLNQRHKRSPIIKPHSMQIQNELTSSFFVPIIQEKCLNFSQDSVKLKPARGALRHCGNDVTSMSPDVQRRDVISPSVPDVALTTSSSRETVGEAQESTRV